MWIKHIVFEYYLYISVDYGDQIIEVSSVEKDKQFYLSDGDPLRERLRWKFPSHSFRSINVVRRLKAASTEGAIYTTRWYSKVQLNTSRGQMIILSEKCEMKNKLRPCKWDHLGRVTDQITGVITWWISVTEFMFRIIILFGYVENFHDSRKNAGLSKSLRYFNHAVQVHFTVYHVRFIPTPNQYLNVE